MAWSDVSLFSARLGRERGEILGEKVGAMFDDVWGLLAAQFRWGRRIYDVPRRVFVFFRLSLEDRALFWTDNPVIYISRVDERV